MSIDHMIDHIICLFSLLRFALFLYIFPMSR